MLERKVDMQELLSYPLAPVPLSLKPDDETKLKTKRFSFVFALETNVVTIRLFSITKTAVFFLSVMLAG